MGEWGSGDWRVESQGVGSLAGCRGARGGGGVVGHVWQLRIAPLESLLIGHWRAWNRRLDLDCSLSLVRVAER
jgi:hypothetical protein